jgi:hypothetical protein
MDFNPEVTIASKIPAFVEAGVTFTLHQLTEAKRIALRVALAHEQARMRELMTEVQEVSKLPKDKQQAIVDLIDDEITHLLHDKSAPVWIKMFLTEIKGLTIKGAPATAQSMLDSGPRDLYWEIIQAIRDMLGLTVKQAGESGPPITSNVSEGGRSPETGTNTTSSDAPSADEKAST